MDQHHKVSQTKKLFRPRLQTLNFSSAQLKKVFSQSRLLAASAGTRENPGVLSRA